MSNDTPADEKLRLVKMDTLQIDLNAIEYEDLELRGAVETGRIADLRYWFWGLAHMNDRENEGDQYAEGYGQAMKHAADELAELMEDSDE